MMVSLSKALIQVRRREIGPLIGTLEGLFSLVGPYVVLLVVWEGVRWILRPDPRFLPDVADVVRAIGRILENGILIDYLSRSLMRIGLAALFTVPVAILVGIGIGLSGAIARFLLPFIRFFNSIPAIAWLPLFIIWLGFNDRTIILDASYGLFFPVAFNTIVGVQTVPRVFRDAILTMGGSWGHLIRDVILPGALPAILTGVRTGFAYAWRGLIAAEMIVATNGLGYLIFQAQTMVLADRIIAGMILIGLTWSILDYFILQPLEEATVMRWGLMQR
jgi:NitT/TauT family transport system permease protein/taurine transport system permease protein